MAFVKFDEPVITRSGRPPPCSRVALALARATTEPRIQPQVVPFGSGEIGSLEDYFPKLLQQTGCQAAWDAYTDVKAAFPQQLSKGTAPLNGFRHYMIQDAIYLEYYVRVRMEAIGTWDSAVPSQELLDFATHIPSSLKYSADTRYTCESQLGVPTAAVDNEWKNGKSAELKNSIKYYEKVVADAILQPTGGNSWLDIHFALLPCIKGYYTIAKALLQDPTTVRNTLYYTLWIEPNADASYTNDYDKFITDHIGAAKEDDWKRWGVIFRTACDHEKEFFKLATTNYQQYDIVVAGNYTISPLASPATFLAVSGDTVTISATSTKWALINSKEGYSVKLADKKFLGVDSAHKVVIKDNETTKWSINPVFIPEKNTYQLFLSGAIQLALDADGTTVTVAKNDPTTQTWILTKVA